AETLEMLMAEDPLVAPMRGGAARDLTNPVVRSLIQRLAEQTPLSGEAVPAPPSMEAHLCLKPPEGPEELGRLGPYRVLKVLGAGGMGVVFQAEDPQLKPPVALTV